MQPTSRPMSLPMKLLYWFVVANAFAAAFSLILFSTNTPATFFWNVAPPISAGMFGVLYLTAGSLVLYVVLRGQWETARHLTAMVPAFTGLMLLTTLLHRGNFDQGVEFTYWLLVYIVAPLAGVAFYLQHERPRANWQVVSTPVAGITRIAAVVAGAGAALFVLVAYVFPALVIAVWPWTISPLMVRVFSSWLSAFAVGLLWFAVEPDWSRLRPFSIMLVGTAALLLVMLGLHRTDLHPDAASAWVFVLAIVLVGALGVFMNWRQRNLTEGALQPSPHSPRA